jgi:hypothetical protein
MNILREKSATISSKKLSMKRERRSKAMETLMTTDLTLESAHLGENL